MAIPFLRKKKNGHEPEHTANCLRPEGQVTNNGQIQAEEGIDGLHKAAGRKSTVRRPWSAVTEDELNALVQGVDGRRR